MAATFLTRPLSHARRALIWVALFSAAINLLMLAGPLYMLQVYDRVLASGSTETLLVLTAMLGVAVLAAATLETQRSAMTLRIGAWLQQALGPDLLAAGVRARIDGTPGGAQAFRDLGQVQTFVGTQGMTAFFDAPWTPFFLVAIWLLHPWLGMLAVGTAVILLALSVLNEVATRRLLREASEAQIGAHRAAEAAVEQADVVRAMGMGAAMQRLWQARNTLAQDALLRAAERGGRLTGTAKFVRLFAQSAILGLGAWLVLRAEATPGVMIAASILLARALAPIDIAMQAWRNFTQARLAMGRLRDLARTQPVQSPRVALPVPKGGLRVQGISTSGRQGAALKRVAFEVGPGEAVAIIGPSAAGKTTLARHLVGLASPLTGTVSLDGVRMDQWDMEALGRHVGYLPQEAALFEGTIRDNIARFATTSDADVVKAAQLARAHEIIVQLPDGYNTQIGPRGTGLSGGQRQRIGLARAVFGTPPLVVLDEPNANLDQTGEAALAHAIRDLKAAGSTLVVIGHRPSTLAKVDHVLILRAGAVHAFGPRAEMLDRLRAARAEQDTVEERPMFRLPQNTTAAINGDAR